MSAVIFRRLLKPKVSVKILSSASVSSRNARQASTDNSNNNVIHSALSELQIPDITIPEYVYNDFGKWPHKVAVECGVTGRKYTYEEVRTKSRNLNRALRKKLKLGYGDVVAILLPNVPEFAISVLGVLEAGLIITTLNPLYTPDEIRRQLADSNSKAIITLGALWPLAQGAVKLLQKQIPIITIKLQENEAAPQGAINFREFTDTNFDIEEAKPNDIKNDTVLMPYSSGTTGLPKGVELTHRNIVANLCQMNEEYLRLAQRTSDDYQDIVPGILPFFHIYGITAVLLNNLYNMCKVVTLPRFTPEDYIKLLAQHKPNVLYIVPPIVLFMSTHSAVKKDYLQSIRTICSGAAPLGALDEEKLLTKAEKHINMVQGYGLTETSPLVFMLSPIRKKQLNVFGSVGEVCSLSSVKIVNPDDNSGQPLGPKQTGELLVKGPQVMKGYHNNPKQTEEAFVDGWFKTGDMVYYDDNRMFYIADRLKELIKVKGFQVAPAELEEIIRAHPDVADCAVIGVPHERDGEVPRAFVVPKPNSKFNSDQLKDYVAEKVAKYKKLRGGVEVVESIPKNASGKIMRRDLKLQYEQKNKLNTK